jgi:hypothetical protein
MKIYFFLAMTFAGIELINRIKIGVSKTCGPSATIGRRKQLKLSCYVCKVKEFHFYINKNS